VAVFLAAVFFAAVFLAAVFFAAVFLAVEFLAAAFAVPVCFGGAPSVDGVDSEGASEEVVVSSSGMYCS
jgi:hypothetical protein